MDMKNAQQFLPHVGVFLGFHKSWRKSISSTQIERSNGKERPGDHLEFRRVVQLSQMTGEPLDDSSI